MAFAKVEGGRIWYADSGGAAPPVLLVHGIAGNSDCWDHLLPSLGEAGFRWLKYDLRSSGRSTPAPGKEGAGSVAGDLEALVSHLELGPFFLVGQAYGGFGALEYALDNPEALKALVITNSMGGISDPGFEDNRARIVAEMTLEERELGPSYRAANPAGVRRFMEIEGRNPRPPTRQALRQPMTLQRLEGIRVPTLLVSSDEDVFAPPPLMRQMAERIPSCEFAVIHAAGHCAYWEQPEEWGRVVLGFLRRHT